jgi:hypothetical protein
VVLAFAAVGIGLAVWAGVWVRYLLESEPEADHAPRAFRLFNAEFQTPGAPWKADHAIRQKLHVHLGLSRQGPADHLGLFLKDYKTRSPSDAELIDEALGKLRSYFRSVEWELTPRDAAPTLGGQPALRLEFVGADGEEGAARGECLIAAHRGYAYWFFTWGAEDDHDALATEWEALRRAFRVLDGREGWKEKSRETARARGQKAAYEITYFSDLWKPQDAADYGPDADVVLEAFEPDPGAKPHAKNAANFYAFVLPKAPDLKAAVAAARRHLEKRLANDGHEKLTFTVVKEKGGASVDRDADLGSLSGHLAKLQVEAPDGGSYQRYMVLGVVPRPQGTLLLVGDCDWERRDFWEQEFTAVLNSLKAP